MRASGKTGGRTISTTTGEGFFEAAKQVVAAIKRGEWTIDILIYPAAFSYRHGIELYLKHLLKELTAYNKSGIDFQKTHQLQDNWKLVEQEAKKSKLRFFDSQELDLARDIIQEFCEIDPTGQVFRYPEDLKGNAHLTGLGVINVEVLDQGMEILHGLVERWRNEFQDLRDAGSIPSSANAGQLNTQGDAMSRRTTGPALGGESANLVPSFSGRFNVIEPHARGRVGAMAEMAIHAMCLKSMGLIPESLPSFSGAQFQDFKAIPGSNVVRAHRAIFGLEMGGKNVAQFALDRPSLRALLIAPQARTDRSRRGQAVSRNLSVGRANSRCWISVSPSRSVGPT